jgi:EAL domain-containing protein (putative c-di-GMP-specific phosphodiesterase class I)
MFDAVREQESGERAELEVALRRAVSQNELELYFQPIINVADGAPWGAEALVRWNRPGCAQVQPMQFIPIAEESSLILDIEQWVLSRACTVLAGWQRDPSTAELRMSVNVSGRHLTEGDLVSEIDDILAITGADPRSLEVELTETQLLADIEHGSRVLSTLRERGIQIAVDDFGTGYASMTYLRQLPVDILKIDRFFVSRALQGTYDCTMIETLLQLGQTLDLAIVAEGVETSEQLDFLSVRGCQRAQGYHFARPMPVADVEAWFAARRLAATLPS